MSAFTHRFSITQDHRAGWFVPVFPVQCDPEQIQFYIVLCNNSQIIREKSDSLMLSWVDSEASQDHRSDISLCFIAVPVFASVLFGVCSRNDF